MLITYYSPPPELVAIRWLVRARMAAKFKRLITAASHWKIRLCFCLMQVSRRMRTDKTADKLAHYSYAFTVYTQKGKETQREWGGKTGKERWKVQRLPLKTENQITQPVHDYGELILGGGESSRPCLRRRHRESIEAAMETLTFYSITHMTLRLETAR